MVEGRKVKRTVCAISNHEMSQKPKRLKQKNYYKEKVI